MSNRPNREILLRQVRKCGVNNYRNFKDSNCCDGLTLKVNIIQYTNNYAPYMYQHRINIFIALATALNYDIIS